MGFWVEQCMHALFECPEVVIEITKIYTYTMAKMVHFFISVTIHDSEF